MRQLFKNCKGDFYSIAGKWDATMVEAIGSHKHKIMINIRIRSIPAFKEAFRNKKLLTPKTSLSVEF
ncbi:MAG: hypothetical protein ACK4ND_16245 [Cytophagaceae bacterium]